MCLDHFTYIIFLGPFMLLQMIEFPTFVRPTDVKLCIFHIYTTFLKNPFNCDGCTSSFCFLMIVGFVPWIWLLGIISNLSLYIQKCHGWLILSYLSFAKSKLFLFILSSLFISAVTGFVCCVLHKQLPSTTMKVSLESYFYCF